MRVIYTPLHELHATKGLVVDGCPFITEEIPARAEIILSALESTNLVIIPEPIDHGLEPILAVHDANFVTYLRTAFGKNAAYFGDDQPILPHAFPIRPTCQKPTSFLGQRGYYVFGAGTPILEGTWQAAYWSVQCALTAADSVRAGGDNFAFALCRPPGHHAAWDYYGGSCFLNNAAAVARYLANGVRVAILDIDYHHGNGTQDIFYQDPEVMFCSLHAHPNDDYPYYWGDSNEHGEGPGEGTNWNWPLPQKTDDREYLKTLEKALDAIEVFSPEYLVVSAGFDIVQGDPVGGFSITPTGLHQIGKNIANLDLPTVIVQEGGYLLESLGDSSVSFLSAFT